MKTSGFLAGVLASLALGLSAHPTLAADDPSPRQEYALQGIGIFSPPITKARKRLLAARADHGDVKAMRELAQRSLRRDGPINYWGEWGDVKTSETWWRRAAALGDVNSMILLGHFYAEPWGVPQDLDEAAKWFRLAADKGRLEAVRDLVSLYGGEWGYDRDDAEAFRWLQRAVEMGDGHSALLMGLRYDVGWGVAENGEQAAYWYRRVIDWAPAGLEEGDRSTALNNLGVLYEKGRGLPKDEAKAALLYGQARSDYNLARLCEAGRGVPQDRAGALWLYIDLAELFGMPEAYDALKRLGYTPRDQDTELKALLDHDKHKVKTTCDP